MEPQRGIFLFLTISNPMFTSIRASTPGQQTNVHTQNRKLARAAMAVSRKTSGSGKMLIFFVLCCGLFYKNMKNTASIPIWQEFTCVQKL